MIKKQGRIFVLLAALTGAALFLCLAGCKGDEDAPAPAPEPPASAGAQAGVSGIGPDVPGALLYEEEPFPGFSDYIAQVDYAISKAVRLSGLGPGSLKAEQGPLSERDGHLYRPQILVVSGVTDIPALTQALRDSLLAWAERAAVMRSEASIPGAGKNGSSLQIVVGGVITHYIFLSPLPEKTGGTGPRLVIVIDDIGESKRQARRLLSLNFPVTFAVWPHSTHAKAIALMAREDGTELIIHQPMQPEGYPKVNPGEGVILEGMDEARILAVLEDSLARVPYAEGMNNHMGSRLTQDEAVMGVVARWLKERGLLALDSLTHARSRFAKAASDAGAVTYKRDIFLDVEADKAKVLAQLKKAEQVALVKGQAVAIGHPLAATLDALEEWQYERDPQIAVVRLKDLTPITPSR